MTTPQERLLLRKARVQAKWARVKEARKAEKEQLDEHVRRVGYLKKVSDANTFIGLHQEHVFMYLAYSGAYLARPPIHGELSMLDMYQHNKVHSYLACLRNRVTPQWREPSFSLYEPNPPYDEIDEAPEQGEPAWFWWVGGLISLAMVILIIYIAFSTRAS